MFRPTAAACLLLLASACTPLQGEAVGDLRVDDPWARATPPGAPVAGGFMTVRNLGDRPDRLVSVRSAAAEKVEIHEMRADDGMMRMRMLPDGLDFPAGASVTLQPGGYHLMFIRPRQPFVADGVVPATLVFERAGSVDVQLQVRDAGARDAKGGHAHH